MFAMTEGLSLDSERWSTLSHAYGSAGDVPAKLREIKRRGFDVETDADLLWGDLCHQGTVYTATYAAVPHIFELIDGDRSLEDRIMLLLFLGEVASTSDISICLEHLRPAYEEAVTAAEHHAVELLEHPGIKDRDFNHLLLAVWALNGRDGWPYFLEWALVNDELQVKCPHCTDSLEFDTAEALFRVQAVKELGPRELKMLSEDVQTNFTEGVDPPTIVSPAQPPKSAWSGDVRAANAYEWLYGAARRANQDETAERIRSLFGECSCPTCHRTFAVMDAEPW